MREYLKKAGIRACVYFTIAMLFLCVAGLMFAGPVEGVVITLSLLLAMGLLTLLQTCGSPPWWPDACTIRCASPASASPACRRSPCARRWAVGSRWTTPGHGPALSSIYLVATALLTIGYALYYRRTVGSLDAALARYRESRKG